MFCEFCGKELKEGEVCNCRKEQKTYQQILPENYGENPELEKSMKSGKAKLNFQIFIGWFALAAAAVLLGCFKFGGDVIFEKIKILQNVQIYVTYLIPALISLAGIIFGIFAFQKKSMRKLVLAELICSMVLILAVGGLFALDFSRSQKIQSLIYGDITQETAATIRKLYRNGSEMEGRQIERKMEEKIAALWEKFQLNDVGYEDVMDELKNIEEIQIPGIDLSETQEKIESLNVSRDSYMEGISAADQKDYANALKNLRKVIENDSNYDTAQEKIKTLEAEYKDEVIKEINNFLTQNKYEEAFRKIEEGKDILPQNEELKSLEQDNEEKYIAYILDQAEKLEGDKKFTEESALLKKALQTVDAPDFQDKLDSLEKYEPVNLLELPLIDSSRFTIMKEDEFLQDTYGNTYGTGAVSDLYQGLSSGYAYFNVDGRFAKITGQIAAHPDMDGSSGTLNNTYRVEIYADNNLVYNSGELSKTSPPVSLDVNINYPRIVQIKIYHLSDRSSEVKVVLGNLQVNNN